MIEAIVAIVGLTLAWQAVIWTVGSVLFPLFWVWMMVDSFIRAEADYPTRSSNEKLVWILLLLFVQPASLLYFFLVHRARPRAVAPAYTQAQPA